MELTSDDAIERLHSHLPEIRRYGVERIALFGSIVTSSTHAHSDLDILVRFERDHKTFDNFMDLKFYLEKLFPELDVDLVLEEALKPGVRDTILRQSRDVA